MNGLKKRVLELEENEKLLNKKVSFLTDFVSGQMVKAIVKQAGKIRKDPTDIKMIDVEEALRFSKLLELTDELKEDVAVIFEWYKEQKENVSV